MGVIIGAPTYETRLFPPVASMLDWAVEKRIMDRKMAVFGSYGWSKGAERHTVEIVKPLKWELIDCFQFAGCPTSDDLRRGEAFGEQFAGQVKNG